MIGILFAAGKRVMLNEDGMYMVLSFYKWPGGGTGRPAALKMLFPNGSVGSSPTRATFIIKILYDMSDKEIKEKTKEEAERIRKIFEEYSVCSRFRLAYTN